MPRFVRHPLLWPVLALLLLVALNAVITPTFLSIRVHDGHLFGSEVETIKVTMGIYKHKRPGYIVWVGRSDFREPAKWVSI